MYRKKIIPVLITCDIDPTPEVCLSDKQKALEDTGKLFHKYGLEATFFIVGNIAKDYQTQLKKLVQAGHEIGCHGYTHDEDEEFNRMTEEQIMSHIGKATQSIFNITGIPVKSFRGPRVKTSHITHKILDTLNYNADSSVCSQRIDFISSNLINPHWVFAPRLPYHPHKRSAFRHGNRKLWEIPVSAIILPFISGVLYMIGVSRMKFFFKLLYAESMLTGKPIVYLLHPSEFAKQTQQVRYSRSLKSVLARGFYFRRKLKLTGTVSKRYSQTEAFVHEMSQFPHVQFMSIDRYIHYLRDK